ncbi:hypothetical protein BWQ96_08395 [Gracilariopsis chorda]|uniref:Uncharacterized protein n=1 Tax=Gracilariopsis chorda TaxID=448386 RepID=A0A2V3IIN7_9FLOR|nr:hypothetical protein BWQ96_08395 [Gracilariopsis chorda]|eukprot:PXF41893.1 hypothetical protein BWQ96_08395 [Gracilariopsis chorda]
MNSSTSRSSAACPAQLVPDLFGGIRYGVRRAQELSNMERNTRVALGVKFTSHEEADVRADPKLRIGTL